MGRPKCDCIDRWSEASAGGFDAFVRKYTKAGAVAWTRQFGTEAADEAFALALDDNGAVYVVGTTGGEFPGHESAGDFDGFLRKYTGAGAHVWTHQVGSAGYDEIAAIHVGPSGRIYVAGSTMGALDAETSAGDVDGFAMKFAPPGAGPPGPGPD